jgi:hypothetical protein
MQPQHAAMTTRCGQATDLVELRIDQHPADQGAWRIVPIRARSQHEQQRSGARARDDALQARRADPQGHGRRIACTVPVPKCAAATLAES